MSWEKIDFFISTPRPPIFPQPIIFGLKSVDQSEERYSDKWEAEELWPSPLGHRWIRLPSPLTLIPHHQLFNTDNSKSALRPAFIPYTDTLKSALKPAISYFTNTPSSALLLILSAHYQPWDFMQPLIVWNIDKISCKENMKTWFQNSTSLFSEKSLATRIQEREDKFKQKKGKKLIYLYLNLSNNTNYYLAMKNSSYLK